MKEYDYAVTPIHKCYTDMKRYPKKDHPLRKKGKDRKDILESDNSNKFSLESVPDYSSFIIEKHNGLK